MNQTVLQMAGQSATGFYTDGLVPWKHYVPVARDNYTDIIRTIQWLNENPAVAENIAASGKQFASAHLGDHGRLCYVENMLKSYAKLQRFNVGKLSDYPKAVPLEAALKRIVRTPY